MTNLSSLLEVASFAPMSLKDPNPWIGHIPFAAWIVKEHKPRRIVELGTHTGNSYFAFCQATVMYQVPSQCYAVDTWQGDEHAGNYDEQVFNVVSEHNASKYSGFSTLMRMTFDEALTHFEDESIDLLHIDGLHTYDAVKHDFTSWLPKLAPGAVVLFHDTSVRVRDFGVWRYWSELQPVYPANLEFTHSNGLGVLQLAKLDREEGVDLHTLSQAMKRSMVDYFNALGTRVEDRHRFASQLESCRMELQNVYRSRSWLLTKPLRGVGRLLRRYLRAR